MLSSKVINYVLFDEKNLPLNSNPGLKVGRHVREMVRETD